MTERTFRTPSPRRPGQTMGLEDVPPVPPMPDTYNNDPAHRRAASLEPSMRVVSPPPTKKGGRVASLDRTPASSQKKLQTQRQPPLTDDNDLERSGSRDSVNFSYPTGARPNSPPPVRPPQFRNQAANGISQQAANDIQHTLNQTAGQPVRRKKKKIASGSTEGSHLANDGMGGKPLGSAVTASAPGTKDPKDVPTSGTKSKRNIMPSETTSQNDDQRESSAHGSDSDSTPEKTVGKRSQRASGLLNKQPSVVREDWEGEQEDSGQPVSKAQGRADAGFSPIGGLSNVQSKKETAIPNTSKKIMESTDSSMREARPTPHLITTIPSTTADTSIEAASHGHLEVSKDSGRPARQTSISPSRSTRFSAHLASEFSGRPRHEPPPRSVSPAKSAMKHHSSSPQSASPIDAAAAAGWKKTSQASSETSDNASTASGDGFGSRSQKRKSARVSFEADPEVVSTAADAAPSDTPLFVSPQHMDSVKKGWLSKSKAGHLDSIPAEDDMEKVMKPRPVLPSFGSVRGRRDGFTESVIPVTEVASPTSSEASSTSNLATLDTSISSDHAIGGILARESLKNQLEANTKPFQTTHSATTMKGADSTDDVLKKRINGTFQSQSEKHGGSSMAPSIPSIAIQPATPGIGETESQDEWLVAVPGGFPGAVELEGDSPPSRTGKVVPQEDREIDASSPAEAGISEPKPSELVAAEDPSVPSVGSFSESLRHQTEPESDAESGGSSVYSDAAEDLSDLEGDGFGSINAIVESPVVGVPADRITTPPDSPLVGKNYNERVGAQSRRDSWDKAEAHWKWVAERQRSIDQVRQKEQDPVQEKPRRKRKTRRMGDAMASAQPSKASTLVPVSTQRTLPQPSAYPVIGKDDASSGQGPMRRSMRDHPEETPNSPGLRSSLRTTKPSQLQARGPAPAVIPKGALQKKKIPASPPAFSPAARSNAKPSPGLSQSSAKPLRRTLSNDSDSSSSFKRSRRPASSGGKFTMRTSMRSADERPTSPPAPAGRGVRSLSPQNRRPFSPMGQGTIRTSMRGSLDAGVPTLRKRDQQKPTSTISGFGKSRFKAKATTSKALASKPKSRFPDSDDDGSEPQTFRSRFEDSSDEEAGMIKYRPVRGIPAKPDAGDSTDLEDSSDDGEKRTAKPKHKSPKSPEILNGVREKAAREPEASSPMERPISPVNGKKKGIFSRFRSKKVEDPARDAPPTTAEREKPVAQSRADLDGARSPEYPASPDSKGKLQRRHIPQRMTSDSWPLPSKPVSDDHVRPKTSDGTETAEGIHGRPGLGIRQDTSGTLRTDGGTPVLGRTGKKKRFPMLRKALGLHD